MPTGYTAGILNGTIKTFKEFAKICSRAFMVHLREEPMNSKYKKREPSTYHTKAIAEAKAEFDKLDSLSDDDIIKQELKEIHEDKKYHTDKIEENKISKERIEAILKEAEAYVPPTDSHEGIAKFMVEQLKKTISFDFSGTYHEDELKSIDNKIETINITKLRAKIKAKAAENLAYHTKEHKEELARCEEHNKWYDDFINSL